MPEGRLRGDILAAELFGQLANVRLSPDGDQIADGRSEFVPDSRKLPRQIMQQGAQAGAQAHGASAVPVNVHPAASAGPRERVIATSVADRPSG